MGGALSPPLPTPPVQVPRIEHADGKFLLLVDCNKTAEGGLYLSCDIDGKLCGSITENDAELWKVLYCSEICTRPILHQQFFNTGRNKILKVVSGKVIASDAMQEPCRDELFYFEFIPGGSHSTSRYYIRYSDLYLGQDIDGNVNLFPSPTATRTEWNLIPSF
jgi:hypothetical protein